MLGTISSIIEQKFKKNCENYSNEILKDFHIHLNEALRDDEISIRTKIN